MMDEGKYTESQRLEMIRLLDRLYQGERHLGARDIFDGSSCAPWPWAKWEAGLSMCYPYLTTWACSVRQSGGALRARKSRAHWLLKPTGVAICC